MDERKSRMEMSWRERGREKRREGGREREAERETRQNIKLQELVIVFPRH